MFLNPSDIKRFWSKVNVLSHNECWNWLAGTRRRGYGRFWLSGKGEVATRVSYFITYGYISDESVLHTCDNPSCVNPDHLFLGTCKDNTNDMMNKGRGINQFKNGENHSLSILKEVDVLKVREMYQNGEKQKEIAKKYNVNQSLISLVVNRRRWNHI